MNTPQDFGPYASDLDPRPANHRPLSPLTFLKRAARVYPDRASVIHGDRRFTWSETYARARRLASALAKRGIGRGDTVSIMATNTPALYEAHFGVPMAGAVLNAINTRLDGRGMAVILDHAETKLLLTDRGLSPAVKDALDRCENRPDVVDIDDVGIDGELLGDVEYESFINGGDPEFDWAMPDDEWQAITLNYTSGTTGNPKGVVYHHRGAFLNAMSNVVAWDMDHHPVYLWTLPMFHCNGWCFPWSLAAVAGTSVCMRKVDGAGIYRAIDEHGVSHFCGAAIVLGMVIDTPEEERRPFEHTVRAMTGGAPPPAAILERIESRGFEITHVYGLTETYGPAVYCAWKEEWDELDPDEQATLKSRQGVPYHVLEGLQVMDPETMEPVPADGETMGEVMFRGNNVMKGYLKNPETTGKAFEGEWFHSGDLGVMNPDGYIQLKDRSKDIIISGGENISSIEVEDCIYKHPAVDAAAVVARPDDKWGETPCAFVSLRSGKNATEQEIIDFCRDNLAHFKCPRSVVFGDLPKTSTGKIQKFKLRDRAEALGSLS